MLQHCILFNPSNPVYVFFCIYANIKNMLLAPYYITFILKKLCDTLTDYVPIYIDGTKEDDK